MFAEICDGADDGLNPSSRNPESARAGESDA